jgi:hypothetical protein
MNLDSVITQIRTYCASFGTRVGGAADFAKGIETTVNMDLPSCYVLPLEDSAGENEFLNGLLQHVNERVAIVIEIDNSSDRRGQGSSDQIEAFKYEIFSAILNWRIDPDRAVRGIQYDSGRLIDFDRARLFWQFEFSLNVTIDDDDGFQVPNVPLTEIDFQDINHPMPVQKVFPEQDAILLTETGDEWLLENGYVWLE